MFAYLLVQLAVSTVVLVLGSASAIVDVILAFVAAYWLARASRGMWVLAMTGAAGSLLWLPVFCDWPYSSGLWTIAALQLVSLTLLVSRPLRRYCWTRGSARV